MKVILESVLAFCIKPPTTSSRYRKMACFVKYSCDKTYYYKPNEGEDRDSGSSGFYRNTKLRFTLAVRRVDRKR